ncbi:alpha/beta hydrolase fold domain-containing protein [Streptomyces sp. NBC_00687]|uniref:alpha/beta hydrolase fold domain-containing protein n=1 Tax=Streptomyces sp. NBC_00687 TaxID=2975807 RepID=UPI0022584BF7|nr:alpha/beta hydrolase [Streptomyces sp. NBC_00687]MCX4919055.1 alpha/beta hydrolase [Streptomyces sp. NBC_00687]
MTASPAKPTVPPTKPSPAMRVVHAVLRRGGVKRALSDVDLTERERRRNEAAGPAEPPRSVRASCTIRWTANEGLPVAVVAPKRTTSVTTPFLYLHGGAYINPIIAHHWRLIAALATENAWTVTVPLYTLAPHGDATDALTRLTALHQAIRQETGVAPALGGDSAGGGLALALAQRLRDQALPGPRHLALFSPWLDIGLENPDIPPVDRVDPTLAVPGLRHAGLLWANGRHPKDPAVSPLHGDHADLCPITVFIGTHDIFLPDCRKFTVKAKSSGTDVALYEFPGAFHVFIAGTVLPESRIARRLLTQRVAGDG